MKNARQVTILGMIIIEKFQRFVYGEIPDDRILMVYFGIDATNGPGQRSIEE